MEPNFPQPLSNNINTNSVVNNQLFPNQNISQIQRISIVKTEEVKHPIQSNIMHNNIENKQIIEETKIITQSPPNPLNFSFKDNNSNSIPLSINQKNNSYRQLIKKIASQLKRPVRPPTDGFFHFALQKGDYSYIIIKKISIQMKNQPIIFNNEIFHIYNQKYIKYRELIKKLAHLLKMKRKNTNINNTTVIKTNITNTNVISSNNNSLNKNININNNTHDKSQNKKIEESNKNIKNKNIIQTNKRAQTQMSIKEKNNMNNYNHNSYSSNINDKIINLTNPFIKSKEKLSFNNPSNYLMKTNLQNPNQFIHTNKEKNSNINTFNMNKSQNITNLNKKQKTITNSQMTVKTVNTNKIKNDNIKNNTMDIIHEETKSNINSKEVIEQKNNIKEEKIIENKSLDGSNTIINSFSNNNNNTTNLVNNFNDSKRIFSNTPINSRFAEISSTEDIEIKNNAENINILSDKNKSTNIINTTILKEGINQTNINNNINNNLNINEEKNSNNMNLIGHSEENNSSSMNINESNLSMYNNYNSDSNKNLTLSSINKEEDKNNSISLDSNLSKKKQIQIKISTFKKETKGPIIQEEEILNSNKESQNININNIQKLNCNTLENNIFNDSIIYQKEISTSVDEISFLKKFDSFLNKNNISIESFIPMAINEIGQQYLKQNAFWEKYINYLYIKYSVNNTRISLFSFIHIIEQYFLWCEDLSSEIVEEFKKLIVENIKKIYNNDEIRQFCFMNKIKTIDELFEKYKLFINIDKDGSFKYDKEIEIKINNKTNEECNCELCKSEKACKSKIIELNKSKIMGVNAENLFLSGKNKKDEDEKIETKRTERKTYPPKNPRSSSAKKKSIKFSASKIKEASRESYGSISKEKKSSSSKKGRKSSTKKDRTEIVDKKIDEFIIEKSINDNEEKENIEDEISEEEKKKKGKNKKKVNSKRRQSNSKSKSRKNEKDSDSEEKETKNKKNKKKEKSKNKKKEKKNYDSDSEDEDEDLKSKNDKKKKKYPKD